MKKSDIKLSKQFMIDNWDDIFPDICLSCGKDVLHSELSGGWCVECNGDLANCESCGVTINVFYGPLCRVCEEDLEKEIPMPGERRPVKVTPK